jgi:antitoxin CptB
MEAAELRRLQWRCRRGLLENDLVLREFLERHGPGLEGERLAAFQALLEYSDNDLWDLISGRADSGDPATSAVVTELRRCQIREMQ